MRPLEEQIASYKHEVKNEFLRLAIDTVVASSPAVDKASGVLLTGVAATLALIVGNIDKVTAFLGATTAKQLLWMLLIAGLFGIAEKYVFVRLQISARANKARASMLTLREGQLKTEDELRKLGATSAQIDIEPQELAREIQALVPWYSIIFFRWKMRRVAELVTDPLYNDKQSAKLYNRQVLYALAQVVTAITAVLFLSVSL